MIVYVMPLKEDKSNQFTGLHLHWCGIKNKTLQALVMHSGVARGACCRHELDTLFNPFTASFENAMTLSVTGVPASCEKFPHPSQLNFWSTKSIFNQFSVFLKTLNALCVWLQYKHPRSMQRVIRSDKPVTLLPLFWSHKCEFGAEPRSRIIATSSVIRLIVIKTPTHPCTHVLACETNRDQQQWKNSRWLVLVIALRPHTPKHINGGWSHYTDTSEPVDGNGAQNMVPVQSGFEPATFRLLAHELTNCSNRAHYGKG
jgi:hypothetical protein